MYCYQRLYNGQTQRSNTGGSQKRKAGPLLPAMDVFSVGCVIAEIFLGGDAPLDLPDVLQYRSAETEPSACLQMLNKVRT
jgi:phosphoinositide-3-kinase, regulatory subunit 4